MGGNTLTVEGTDTDAPAAPAGEARPDRRERPGGLTAAILAGNATVRRGIDGVLRAVPGVGTVHECVDRDELASLVQLEHVDLVLVTAPDGAPLDATLGAVATILMVVDRDAKDDLPRFAASFAHGFLWQQSLTPTRLHDALHRCRTGEVPMPADLARSLLARADVSPRRGHAAVSLTSRERQALSLLVKGLSNKQIARSLSISSHGAKRLVTSIMLKLDAPNRTLAAVVAVRTGLVREE